MAPRYRRQAHHRGSYDRRSQMVRDTANADPTTRCWRCNGLAREGDPWQAGHLRDADAASPLAPEHRSCNIRAARQAERKVPPSEDW